MTNNNVDSVCASDLAKNILLNASDYIGNKPEEFDNADNKALETIRNNTAFRYMVIGEVESFPEDYINIAESQKEAAEFVWSMYLNWAS